MTAQNKTACAVVSLKSTCQERPLLPLFSFLRSRRAFVAVSIGCGMAVQWPCRAGDEIELLLAKQRSYEAIDLSQFADSIHHWQMKDGRDRNDQRYKDNQIIEIAENLLKFQNDDGGWQANLDWQAMIEVSEIRRNRNGSLGRSTFDNRNVYPQIDYLAQVFQVTGLKQYQDGAIRGLEYILQEQRPSGGWRGSDVDAITFNDDVMVGIMSLLLKIREENSNYQWLDSTLRARLFSSLNRGIEATLSCQIRVNGRKTAWCQQHDHATYEPIRARTYELPSITAQESVGVVRFLMQLPDPSPALIDAIHCSIDWFESAKICGVKINTVSIAPVRYKGFTAKIDRIVIQDDQAAPIWSRYYEIGTNRPFFCNRDGKKVYRLSDVLLERRVGYGWYGYWPADLIANQYPAWKLQISEKSNR